MHARAQKQSHTCTHRTHIQTYMSPYLNTHTHTHTLARKHAHPHTHEHTHTHTHEHTHTHTHTRSFIHTCIHTKIHTHIHTYRYEILTHTPHSSKLTVQRPRCRPTAMLFVSAAVGPCQGVHWCTARGAVLFVPAQAPALNPRISSVAEVGVMAATHRAINMYEQGGELPWQGTPRHMGFLHFYSCPHPHCQPFAGPRDRLPVRLSGKGDDQTTPGACQAVHWCTVRGAVHAQAPALSHRISLVAEVG